MDLYWGHLYSEKDNPDGDDYFLSVISERSYPQETIARVVRIEGTTYEEIDHEFLFQQTIFRRFIPRRVLTPGTLLAVRTTKGALAKLRVVRYYSESERPIPLEKASPMDTPQAPRVVGNGKPFDQIEIEWTLYLNAADVKPDSLAIARARLTQAIRFGDAASVGSLLASHPGLLKFTTDSWASPLQEAALWGNAEVLTVLLKAGIDPNQPADEPPLMCAVKSGRLENVEVLCAHGADVNAITPDETLLSYAVYWGDPRIVEYLLVKGTRLPATQRERKLIRKALREGVRHVQESFGLRLPDTADLALTDHEATRRVLERYGYR
ncbi:MAG: ankyrin repeat domain-containing protein [Candidatus Hydrogenedentales bacterium]